MKRPASNDLEVRVARAKTYEQVEANAKRAVVEIAKVLPGPARKALPEICYACIGLANADGPTPGGRSTPTCDNRLHRYDDKRIRRLDFKEQALQESRQG